MVVDSEDYHVFCLHKSKSDANAAGGPALQATSASNGLISNASATSGDQNGNKRGLYSFVRYYVSVRTNRLCKEVHIDWGDTTAAKSSGGRKTSESSIEILTSDLPTSHWTTSHIFTKAGIVKPMIRCKGIDGFLSKWYVNNESAYGGEGLNINAIVPNESEAGAHYDQNSFSIVSVVSSTTPSMPALLFAPQPPIAVIKGDKKRIKSGIENLWLGQGHGSSTGTQLRDENDDTLTNSDGTAFNSVGATIFAEVSKRTRSGSPIRRTGVQIKVTYKDMSTKQVYIKTLTCDGGGTNNKITGVAEVLKIQLLNLKENTDTYMNNTGAGDTTLAPGERVFLYSDVSDSSGNDLNEVESQDYANTDNMIGFVSNGNPIMSLDDPETILNADFSETKTREWNTTLEKFYFDDDKMHPMKRTAQLQLRKGMVTIGSSTDSYITDQLNNNYDTTLEAETTTRSFRYSLSRNQDFLDSDYRFLSSKRLLRLQAETTHHDDYDTYGGKQKYSPIISFRNRARSSITTGTANTYPNDNFLPKSLQQWTFGALLMTNNPGHGTSTAPTWFDMNGYNNRGRWPLLTSDGSCNVTDGSLDTTNGSAVYAVDDTDGLRVGQACTAGANGDIISIDSLTQFTTDTVAGSTATNTTLKVTANNNTTMSSGTDIETDPLLNWMFIAHRKKFDRLFWRTTHKRGYFDAKWSSNNAAQTSPVNVGYNYPKYNVQIFYPAYRTATSDEIIFKPLSFHDGTKDPDSDYSTFLRSGEFVWDYPDDWAKTKHSSDVIYPVNNTNFEKDGGTASQGLDDAWKEDSWGLLIGINVENTDTSNTPSHQQTFWNISRVHPYNNSHSLLVEIEDPMHISLNKRAISSSVSYVRKGNWQTITNRLGIPELRRVGASGGTIKLGGVDLASADDREKFQYYQKRGKPVYYDVEHVGDNTTTRLYGFITDMSEDTPTAKVHPKFTCKLDITKVLEFNTTTGAMISDGYISLGGELGGKYKYVSGS